MVKKNNNITNKKISKINIGLSILYIIAFILSILSCLSIGFAVTMYIYLIHILCFITPLYLCAECIDINIKDKRKRIGINLVDYILGVLVLWIPHIIAIRLYELSPYLYGVIGLIFCSIPFIKFKLSNSKINWIKWIRIITRFLFIIAIILVLEACSHSSGAY